jgi:hypothetical protein
MKASKESSKKIQGREWLFWNICHTIRTAHKFEKLQSHFPTSEILKSGIKNIILTKG